MYLGINMETLFIKNTYSEYALINILHIHMPHYIYHIHTIHKICISNTYHVFSKNIESFKHIVTLYLYRLNAEYIHVNC